MKGRAAVSVIVLAALAAIPAAADAGTVRYPGPSPCAKKLQRCIDKSPRGTRIRIAKNGPIKESLEVEKSISLVPAPGFDPVIGADDAARDLDVRNAGSKKVKVALRGIEFRNVEISVEFGEGSGHRFVLEDSSLASPLDDSGDGVDVGTQVPAKVEIRDNDLATLGDVVQVDAAPGAGTASVAITGNRITTSDAPAGVGTNDSGSGVYLPVGGAGQVEADVEGNLVYGVAGCNCGGAAGIKIRGDAADATVNLVGNTVDDAQFASSALDVGDDDPGSLVVNAFDNIFSNASQDVVDLPNADPSISITHDFNDVYDPGDPPDYNGYPPGPYTDAQDPLYIDAAGGDYRLQAASPQKQQGLVCPPGGQSAVDLAGNDRVERVPGQGAFVTPGAFGFAMSPPAGMFLLGTDGPDDLDGGSGDDLICAYGGDDTVTGRKGDDVVFGGDGADEIGGGAGDDFLYGEDGDDVITDLAGADYLSGGDDFDTIDAHDGIDDDVLDGGGGVDACNPDPGDAYMNC